VTDQHITAIATVLQVILLLVSAVLVGWYLWETRKMRTAAEAQVTKSQQLVTAAQQQVEASLQQVEATFRPAVVATAGPSVSALPYLVNIGNGPAIEIRWSITNSKLGGNISYLEPRQEPYELNVGGIKSLYNAALQVSSNTVSIECEYRSLSGRKYTSSNAYDFDKQRFSTTFTG
jgi:hypothetical protein